MLPDQGGGAEALDLSSTELSQSGADVEEEQGPGVQERSLARPPPPLTPPVKDLLTKVSQSTSHSAIASD